MLFMSTCIDSEIIDGANGQNVVLSFWRRATYSVGGTERVQEEWYVDTSQRDKSPKSYSISFFSVTCT